MRRREEKKRRRSATLLDSTQFLSRSDTADANVDDDRLYLGISRAERASKSSKRLQSIFTSTGCSAFSTIHLHCALEVLLSATGLRVTLAFARRSNCRRRIRRSPLSLVLSALLTPLLFVHTIRPFHYDSFFHRFAVCFCS